MAVSKKRKKNIKRKIKNNKTMSSTDKNSKNEKSILKKGVYNVLNNYELDIMPKWFDYTDSKYIDLELRTKGYFDDTFDVYIKGFKELLYKSIITNTEEFDSISRGYIEKWIKDLAKFIEGFSIEIISYFDIVRNDEIDLQDIFDNLYYEYNNEFIVKKRMKELMKKVEEKNMVRLEEYYAIYEEEYISYTIQLILSKGHLIDNTIREFLKHKNSEYEYNDNKFIEDSTSKLLYIDKYQELNKIAEKHGYYHARDNGGHGIFTNDKTKKSIVIPQGRKIGRGLSILIQKQILGEANPIIGAEKININEFEENEKLIKFQKRLDEVNYIMKENRADGIKEVIKIADEYPDVYLLDDTANNAIMKLREEEVLKEIKPFIYSDNYKIAIEKAEEFLRKYPSSTKIIGMLGAFYSDSGNKSKSIEYYKKYISMNGEDYDAYNNIIKLLKREGREEEADLYTQIMRVKFMSKINDLEEIKEAIDIENFDYAVELINKFEKEYSTEISADDFIQIVKGFLLKGNYKLVRKYSNYLLEKFTPKDEIKQLIKVLDSRNL